MIFPCIFARYVFERDMLWEREINMMWERERKISYGYGLERNKCMCLREKDDLPYDLWDKDKLKKKL